MVLSMEECQTLDILCQRCVGLDGSEYQRWVRLDGSEYGGMSNSRHTVSKTTFASAVAIMALLMGDSSWATHRKVLLSKSDSSASPIFNVMDYGAHGSGLNDDRTAFQEAWQAACTAPSDAVFQVPSGKKFLVTPVTFPGPCKSHISVEAMSITGCSNVLIRNLQFVNSQQMHLAVVDSSEIQLSGLQIQAPEDSPNTDGIHIQRVQNAQIDNCVIETGDDCISISSGSSTINVKNINCGPGHGISIGSLGENGEAAKIDDILVQNVTFSGTSNGARIKTWQGGSGYARNITFEDIVVDNVKNPIIIDQYYCDSSSPCKIQSSAVQIKDVTFKNIHGTSSTNVAVNFSCSETVPCTGITLENVHISSTAANTANAICTNALGMALGTTSPPSCLKD
eukprot:PITA_17299